MLSNISFITKGVEYGRITFAAAEDKFETTKDDENIISEEN